MLKAGTGAIQKWVVADALTDPYVVVYAARVSVWGRWFVWLVLVFQLLYRPGFWYPEDIEYLLVHMLVLSANGLVHHRLRTHRPVTWRWMLFLSATYVALITVGVVIGGGFTSLIFLAYYPTLAIFAVVFSSRWLTLAWTTTTAVAYAAVSLTVGSGLDLGAGKEKVLVARLALMYTIVLGISLISRFERSRWQTSVTRERQLRQERIEALPDDPRHHRSERLHDRPGHTSCQEPGDDRTRNRRPPWTQSGKRSRRWRRSCPLELRPTPRGESLERFLAKLPDLWRQDASHTSRERRVQPPRTWRTRPDPFKGVWCDVLGWLQEDPDASAVALLGRLQEAEPDRFSRAHLRTLQRRVQEWRGIMAKKLVYAMAGEPMAELPAMPELALAGGNPRC